MKVTFVDSDVLMAAFQAKESIAKRAIELLDDPGREFASSEFVRLEVLPKPIYGKRLRELEFHEAYFSRVTHWAPMTPELLSAAFQEACLHGLSALDALHIAAASELKADELVTGERPAKPMHRSRLVKIVSLRANP